MGALSSTTAPASVSALLALDASQAPDLYEWQSDLAPILAAGPKGRGQRIAALAEARDVPVKTVRKKFDLFAKQGLAGLMNKKFTPQLWQSRKPVGLSAEDEALVKLWCESWQRKSEPALRALRAAWRAQKVSPEMRQRGLAVPATSSKIDPTKGYPIGWSLRNLMRYAPSEYELKAARIGRSAAAAHRPLVYTTRRDLYVGQYYLWDDMWHDHVCNDLDQVKSGRPLEFHGLDLASAAKIGWGSRIRLETEKGHEGLKAGDFRFLLAAVLGGTGYNSRGTALVVEHGTAAISDAIEGLLSDASRGAITVARSGMEGAAAHAGQYAGRAKGNFRFKAALESLGNLIHNEMAYLPGQVGMDRDHCPEEMHDGGRLVDAATGRPLNQFGALKHNDALLAALALLPAERAQWLQWDFCSIQQFRLICEEVYARINARVEHELEGWDERYVPDPRTGKMRRLSPWEVWTPGRRALRPIDEATQALLIGTEAGEELTARNGMLTTKNGEISGDALRFDATGLPDKEKFLTVLNPFDASRLWVFDSRSSFVGALPRIASVSRADVEGVQRAMGAASKREAQLLQPMRQRHLAEAREKLSRHERNAEVLSGQSAAETRRQERAVEKVDLVAETLARPRVAKADPSEAWQ